MGTNWWPKKQREAKTTWRRTFKTDLAIIGKDTTNMEIEAADRVQWRLLAARCAVERGKN